MRLLRVAVLCAKNKAPFTGTVVSVKRIVGAAATGETCDIVIRHGYKMPYWEGQSYGVIPPGTNPKNGARVHLLTGSFRAFRT
jgi:ferredoxin--NADP+ reductase